MKQYTADRSAIRLLQMAVLALDALVIIAAWLSGMTDSRLFSISMWTAAGICTAAALLVCLLYLPLYFRNLECAVTQAQITVRSGILFKRERSVRLQTVQFVQIITGPGDGIWGMNFILLHVYGGRLLLPFLARQDRQALTEFLRTKGVFHAP